MRHFAAIAAGILTALFVAGAAHAQSPTPDSIAAAKELVVAARTADQFRNILPLLTQQIKPLIAQGRPEIERDYDKIMPVITEAFSRQADALVDEIAKIYASNFTADELRTVTAFYRTPAGQKFLEKTPLIAQQSMAAGQKFGQKVTQDLQARIMEELRKRGHNI